MLPWLEPVLEQALQVQRAHALLVHGPAGVGQFEFAMALAAAWLCEAPAAARPRGLACGQCESCKLVAGRSHPDLRLVVPEALRGMAGLPVEEQGSDDDGKKRKPSREIKVDQVRAALDFSTLTAGRGGAKVMVLHPAEQVNHISANALLKTLEEPAGSLRFILSCSAPHALLPTIRSRCQAVHLALPPRDTAVAWLTAQGIDGPGPLLDACGGQPLTALERAGQGMDAAAWAQLPGWVAGGQVAALAAWPLPVLVEALQRLCHDQLMVALDQPPRFFAAQAMGLAPGQRGDVAALTAWAAELRQLARHAEHPWNTGLATEAILQRARNAAQPAGRNARVNSPR
jgi:DNA polymerase-3 subunit delta'